jgi:hypothetical protein
LVKDTAGTQLQTSEFINYMGLGALVIKKTETEIIDNYDNLTIAKSAATP